MSFVARTTYYFDSPGPSNTPDCARFAIERATELGLKKIVVASTSGDAAMEFFRQMQGTALGLIVVTHVVGFSKPGVWEFSPECAERLKAGGVTIVTGTHALSGLERSFSRAAKVGGDRGPRRLPRHCGG